MPVDGSRRATLPRERQRRASRDVTNFTVSDVITGANVGQVGIDVPAKFGDSIPNGSRDIQRRTAVCSIFDRFLNFDNCQPEVTASLCKNDDNDDAGVRRSSHKGKRLMAFCLKNVVAVN